MFGKNHKRNARIFATILSVAVILSMVFSYFALLF
jgi:hypothetical protein